MPQVKSISAITDKWKRRAGAASQDYAAGVASPRRSWSQATVEAADAQAAGVQQAISEKRFEKGVTAAGDSKWSAKAKNLGATRYGPGVAAATGDYQSGFSPFVSVIEGITLPPRGPKGDPRNYERSAVIGQALHDAKTGK
jgi:hypothetical protein